MQNHRNRKRILITAAFLCCTVATSYSQDWFWKNPLPQGNDIHAMCYAGGGVLYGVGEFGTIIKSTNSGSNWFLLERPTTVNLRGISFPVPDRGMAVGDGGTVLKTTDGGISWTQQIVGAGVTLYGVSFTDVMTGTVVGYPGIVLRTTDGGLTWEQQLAGGGDRLHAVQFIDERKGAIVGSQGVIFRTTNAGKSWSRQVDSTTRHLYSVSLPDSMNGYAVGENGLILHTSDGGKIWSPQQSGNTYLLSSVSFSDPNNGIVVGESNAILTTTDGGTTWTAQAGFIGASLTTVLRIDAGTVIATGMSGIVLKSTDGGVSWTKRTVGSISSLYGVAPFDDFRMIAVGQRGEILATSDRGASWVPRTSGVSSNLLAVATFGSDTAVAVGENGTIVRTEDGGVSWMDASLTPIPGETNYLSGIAFSSTGKALIVGHLGRPEGQFTFPYSLTLRSNDRGRTWSRTLISFRVGEGFAYVRDTLNSVSFVDSLIAMTVGAKGRMLRSTDAGVKWDTLTTTTLPNSRASASAEAAYTTQNLHSVAFSKSHVGVGTAVGAGGVVLHTADSGLTWGSVVIPQQNLRSISYGDTTFAMAVGDNGQMYHSSNGGRNWSDLSFLGTQRRLVIRTNKTLYGVSLFADNIVLVGEGGIILGREGPDIPVVVEYEWAASIPSSITLRQNYPNPFNPVTVISFQLSVLSDVKLSVFDLLGHEIAVLVNERKPAGTYQVTWNASHLASGMYICRLSAGGAFLTRKLLLIK